MHIDTQDNVFLSRKENEHQHLFHPGFRRHTGAGLDPLRSHRGGLPGLVPAQYLQRVADQSDIADMKMSLLLTHLDIMYSISLTQRIIAL